MVDILANLITQTRQLSSLVKLEAVALTSHLLKQSQSHAQNGYFSSPTGQSLLEKLLRTIIFCIHDQLPNLFNHQTPPNAHSDFAVVSVKKKK